MPATNLSPNVDNYFLGRGIVYWRRKDPVTGDLGAWRDMGNCPSLQFKAAVKNLDHFSSRQGLKIKDKSIPIDANATLVVQLEEWTSDNLALAMMGEEGINPFQVMSASVLEGSFFLSGTNDVGARVTVHFPKVNLTPTGTLEMIGGADKFGVIELTADLLATVDDVAGTTSFGELTWDTAKGATPP